MGTTQQREAGMRHLITLSALALCVILIGCGGGARGGGGWRCGV